jgi:hypothetical protein
LNYQTITFLNLLKAWFGNKYEYLYQNAKI